MTDSGRRRPVAGFVSTWPLYVGTTIDRHAHALLSGIMAAAAARECDLLVAAGVTSDRVDVRWRSVWPVPSPDTDLVPVGPWNTDGLIVVPDDLDAAQSEYLRDLQDSGFPIVFTTPEAPGPRVVADNRGGIREAVGHLLGHGHRDIAFVAGKQHRTGDSAERLVAFQEALGEAGLAVRDELIAFGEHRRGAGRSAMERILASGLPFSAFVASNDQSCLGALEALAAAGIRVPDDVAAVGFDDIIDARSNDPALTTIRHPTFALGYEALAHLADRIARLDVPEVVIEPTRLVVRRSCGCTPDGIGPEPVAPGHPDPVLAVAEAMTVVAEAEASRATHEELRGECHRLLAAILAAARAPRQDVQLRLELAAVLDATEARDDDPHLWQSALSALYRNASVLAATAGAEPAAVLAAADLARSTVAERAQRQTTRVLLDHIDTTSRLGLLTSQLLAARDLGETSQILEEHLPGLGVQDLLACRYVPDADDPGDRSEVIVAAGLAGVMPGQTLLTRAFPFAGVPESGEPRRLLILPLRLGPGSDGFVAMTTSHADVAAAIAGNLGSAIRSSELYAEAMAGRRMAEEADRVKSRFLSTVGHELRTPLSVVVGLSDLLLRAAREDGDLPEPILADLERLDQSATHLGRLIGDVLDLASGETGRLRLQLEVVDLCVALQGAVAVAREMTEACGLRFEASLPEPGPLVRADATRLRQVVLNLVSNAVKFTGSGFVRLEVTVEVGREVVITVTDSGVGIPSSAQSGIFAGFGASPRTPVNGRPGLGIGLAIARDLVELHGGHLSVRSPIEGDAGSAFSFTLPILAAGATDGARTQPGQAGTEEDPVTSVPNVLVVDDDPSVLELHARLVLEAGARPLRASSGSEALDVLASEPVDLVMLDLHMADGDGYEALRAMRLETATRDIPVIVVTGQDLEDDDLERLDREVVAIVGKGLLDATETRARIEAALAHRRGLGGPARRIVRRAALYIDHHHAEALSREDIARQVAISPDYLTDCFRQELGLTPMVYLVRCRIRHARALLETTDDPVTAIALAVGFSDASHFTRTFHREVGVSPRAYRRAGRAEPAGIRQEIPAGRQDPRRGRD